jgi:hypothetical protein
MEHHEETRPTQCHIKGITQKYGKLQERHNHWSKLLNAPRLQHPSTMATASTLEQTRS